MASREETLPLPGNQPPTPKSKAGWSRILSDIWNRQCSPLWNPIFTIYFLFVVVLVAGLGLWITLIRHFVKAGEQDAVAFAASCQSVLESAGTYAIAISATALADVILSKQTESRAFRAVSIALTVLVTLFLCAVFALPLKIALFGAIGSFCLSLYQWWIINANNPNLDDDDDPSQLTGGDPLGALSGSLQGFKT